MVQVGTCRNDSLKGQGRIPNQQVCGGCSLRNPASGLQPFRQPELTGSGHFECGDSRFELAKHDRIARSRSEEHTSELQSLMRISYAVFCLNKKKKNIKATHDSVNKKQHTTQHKQHHHIRLSQICT